MKNECLLSFIIMAFITPSLLNVKNKLFCVTQKFVLQEVR